MQCNRTNGSQKMYCFVNKLRGVGVSLYLCFAWFLWEGWGGGGELVSVFRMVLIEVVGVSLYLCFVWFLFQQPAIFPFHLCFREAFFTCILLLHVLYL